MGPGFVCKGMGVALHLAHELAMARAEQWTVEEGEYEGRRDSRGQKRKASSVSVKGGRTPEHDRTDKTSGLTGPATVICALAFLSHRKGAGMAARDVLRR